MPIFYRDREKEAARKPSTEPITLGFGDTLNPRVPAPSRWFQRGIFLEELSRARPRIIDRLRDDVWPPFLKRFSREDTPWISRIGDLDPADSFEGALLAWRHESWLIETDPEEPWIIQAAVLNLIYWTRGVRWDRESREFVPSDPQFQPLLIGPTTPPGIPPLVAPLDARYRLLLGADAVPVERPRPMAWQDWMSEEEYDQILRGYKLAIKRQRAKEGFTAASRKNSGHLHYRWLVCWQCPPHLTKRSLADEYSVTPHAIRKALKETAQEIALALREASPGRPKNPD